MNKQKLIFSCRCRRRPREVRHDFRLPGAGHRDSPKGLAMQTSEYILWTYTNSWKFSHHTDGGSTLPRLLSVPLCSVRLTILLINTLSGRKEGREWQAHTHEERIFSTQANRVRCLLFCQSLSHLHLPPSLIIPLDILVV